MLSPPTRSAGSTATAPVSVDTVLHPRMLLPMAPVDTVLTGTSVAIDAGRIQAVGPRDELTARYRAGQEIELDEHVLMPGLVNAHGHLAMSLLRGLGEGQPLDTWLRETIWPLEGTWVDRTFVADGVDLAIAEMVATGTTCASDMYYFPEAAAARAVAAGFRTQLAFPVIDAANAWSQNAAECIHKGLELYDQYRAEALVQVAFGPHAAYTVDDSTLQRVLMLADELEAGIQIHLHETSTEVEHALRKNAVTWIEHLDRLGLLIPRLQAVHMTQIAEAELELLAERGPSIVHCPSSNMKLASGICPIPQMLERGLTIALGTDGAASNNSLDLFFEARLAALLAKSSSADPTAAPAPQMLQAATLGGAAALGLERDIGSIEAGKLADVIAIDLAAPGLQPLHDLHAQLLHANASRQVSHTWIAGRLVYDRDGELRYPTLDVDALLARCEDWRQRLDGGQPA